MANGSFSLGRAFSEGWQAFARNVWVAILGVLVYVGIEGVIGWVPCVGPLAQLIVAGPFLGGMCLFALHLLRQANPSVGDVFAGFSKFGRYLGLYWLLFLIGIACAVPTMGVALLVGLGVGMAAGEDAGVAVGVTLGVIAFIVWYAILVRWSLAYYVVADDWEEGSVFTSLRKSAQITKGTRIKLFLSLIVLSLFGVIGVLACIVGVLLTGSVAMCATASIYQQLKESAAGTGAPGAVTGPVR
jgi:uncharacterized membrane protein